MGFRQLKCNLIAAHFKLNYDNIIRKIMQSKKDPKILEFCPLDWLESMIRHMDDIITMKSLQKHIDDFGHGYICTKTSVNIKNTHQQKYTPKGSYIYFTHILHIFYTYFTHILHIFYTYFICILHIFYTYFIYILHRLPK